MPCLHPRDAAPGIVGPRLVGIGCAFQVYDEPSGVRAVAEVIRPRREHVRQLEEVVRHQQEIQLALARDGLTGCGHTDAAQNDILVTSARHVDGHSPEERVVLAPLHNLSGAGIVGLEGSGPAVDDFRVSGDEFLQLGVAIQRGVDVSAHQQSGCGGADVVATDGSQRGGLAGLKTLDGGCGQDVLDVVVVIPVDVGNGNLIHFCFLLTDAGYC